MKRFLILTFLGVFSGVVSALLIYAFHFTGVKAVAVHAVCISILSLWYTRKVFNKEKKND